MHAAIRLPGVSAGASGYEDTISLEIRGQYDQAIVERSRPGVVTITQSMIWSLRDTLDHGTDACRFELDARQLSTVQTDIPSHTGDA